VDVKTLPVVVKRLRGMGVEQVVFVADRGCVSKKNLEEIGRAGLDYIVGLRLRRAGDLVPAILADTSPYEQVQENLLAKAVEREGKRWIVCYSPETAERDLKMRGRALERLNQKLEAVGKARDGQKAESEILGHHLFRRWVERDTRGNLVVSREKVVQEGMCDGTFVLETSNERLSPAEVALGYKGLLRVERAWQSLKHVLDIQPVFVRTEERIRAHVTLCMIAYLLERWAEIATGESFEEIRRQLRPMHATELIEDGQSLWKPSRLSAAQESLWKKLEISPPGKVVHVGPISCLPPQKL